MQFQKEFLVEHVLKNIGKNAKILEIYCGNGCAYNIIQTLGYKNYIGIDDNLKNIIRCKTIFKNFKNNFIYCENINEYIAENNFDIIFCMEMESYKHRVFNCAIKSAKCKIVYCITKRLVGDNPEKICILHRKLCAYTHFYWNIFYNKDYNENKKYIIVGTNYSSINFVNKEYLILKNIYPDIIDNMTNYDFLIEILSMILKKYTLLDSDAKVSDIICKNNIPVYISNNELHIITPFICDAEIQIDNDVLTRHILDKGDVIIINKLNYFLTGKCFRIIF